MLFFIIVHACVIVEYAFRRIYNLGYLQSEEERKAVDFLAIPAALIALATSVTCGPVGLWCCLNAVGDFLSYDLLLYWAYSFVVYSFQPQKYFAYLRFLFFLATATSVYLGVVPRKDALTLPLLAFLGSFCLTARACLSIPFVHRHIREMGYLVLSTPLAFYLFDTQNCHLCY